MPHRNKTQTREDRVEAFQNRIGAPTRISLLEEQADSLLDMTLDSILFQYSEQLKVGSTKLKQIYKEIKANNGVSEERLMRAQLMLEELSEALCALSTRDEIDLLDALADLSYVVSGTATTYDLPLEEAFIEVHRSNMTKGEVKHAEGIKGKGVGYSAPNLHGVLLSYRHRN